MQEKGDLTVEYSRNLTRLAACLGGMIFVIVFLSVVNYHHQKPRQVKHFLIIDRHVCCLLRQ